MPPPKRPPKAPSRNELPSDKLRAVIVARGLSASAIARAAEVAPSMLTRFLAGDRGLSLDTFDRVSQALGLKLVEGGRRDLTRG